MSISFGKSCHEIDNRFSERKCLPRYNSLIFQSWEIWYKTLGYGRLCKTWTRSTISSKKNVGKSSYQTRRAPILIIQSKASTSTTVLSLQKLDGQHNSSPCYQQHGQECEPSKPVVFAVTTHFQVSKLVSPLLLWDCRLVLLKNEWRCLKSVTIQNLKF